MKTFTTSSGYMFKFFEIGDVCKVIKAEYFKSKFKPGTVVKCITNMETFSREMKIINELTGETDFVSIAQLELVKEAERQTIVPLEADPFDNAETDDVAGQIPITDPEA